MENNELEQMKAQMAALEKKIADQEIVNDRLLGESMKNKMSWIKRYIVGEMIAIPIAALIWISISKYAGIPLWFTLIFVVGCVIDVYYDWKVNVTPIRENNFCRQNLVETAEKLRKMKKLRYKQTLIGTPLAIAFFAAIIAYAYFANVRGTDLFDTTSDYNMAFLGCCIGLLIGSAVAICLIAKLLRKMQQSNDAIIRQIEEITREEKD